jgi:sec-independent protein translocase protein TatA
MPSIGPLEIAIILVIVLVIFGAKRIPELGRSLGKGMRGFKGALEGDEDDEPEPGDRELPSSTESTAEKGAGPDETSDRGRS